MSLLVIYFNLKCPPDKTLQSLQNMSLTSQYLFMYRKQKQHQKKQQESIRTKRKIRKTSGCPWHTKHYDYYDKKMCEMLKAGYGIVTNLQGYTHAEYYATYNLFMRVAYLYFEFILFYFCFFFNFHSVLIRTFKNVY